MLPTASDTSQSSHANTTCFCTECLRFVTIALANLYWVDWYFAEILRAAKIVRAMDEAHAANLGAADIEHEGTTVMIDAPMILQVIAPFPSHITL